MYKKIWIWMLLVFININVIFAQDRDLDIPDKIDPIPINNIDTPKITPPSWKDLQAAIRCASGATPWKRNESTKACICPSNTMYINWVCRSCDDDDVCCGIKLNTSIPFIGNCIKQKNKWADKEISEENAFPTLIGHLMKILLTVIILWGFAGIVAGWVMIAAAGADDQKAKNGKKMIVNIAIALAVLGASGVILRLINPNFFL